MSKQRKPAAAREKELKLAIYRIERGRAHTAATKLSVSAVAREAGVTPALIHNHYPSIAEEIRVKLGASSRERRNAALDVLKQEREKSSKLRKELAQAMRQIAKLASINETLLLENQVLRGELSASNVRRLGAKNRVSVLPG
ncbi:TetR family transcriptional regulator [Paraburkholderia adhaesiva]|uniref:TetR family transcriptional regulator n=1 Tax=Paraburkholderia adhaesiva TaxID=2883244 RepID=UPI001F338E74|nr:TetR family transcriptional regulator [Paraburkholderia adhaesiva]